ncbi:Antidote-toxin recognition MazE, bacterial antitoxin [Candidatus Burarchaeum australiense]|nr:Antidote-toxin recognition MazE, bacterial antitoxin [Candidatus Burarchaeum australiense]
MTERKLQFTGGSSFIVSLPKDWVSKYGLRAGSVVYMATENDGSLRLSPKKIEAGPRECVIDQAGAKNTLRRIIAAYVAGADTIVVKGKDTAEACEEARLRLSGLEIVEEQREKTVMRVLIHEEELNFNVLMKRLYIVSEVLCNLAIRAVSKREDVKLEAQRRDNDADRLYLLIMRCLYNGTCANSPIKTLTAKGMERVADHAELLCMTTAKLGPDPVLGSLLKDAVQLYADAFKSLTEGKPDESIYDRCDAVKKQFQAKLMPLIQKEPRKEKVLALEGFRESSMSIVNRALSFSEMASNLQAMGVHTHELEPITKA